MSVVFWFKKDIDRIHLFAWPFPVGLVIWGLTQLFFVLSGLPNQRVTSIGSILIMTIGLFILRWRMGLINRDEMKLSSLFILLFGFISGIALVINLSIFTNDSWVYYIGGEYLGHSLQFPDSLFAMFGVFQYALMSAGPLYGFDYVYAVFPLMLGIISILIYHTGFSIIGEYGLPRGQRIFYSLVTALFPFSSFMVLLSSFYISSNTATAFFSFLSIFAIWKRITTGKKVWLFFSALMIIPIGLLRLEGSIIVLINLVIVLSLKQVEHNEKKFHTVIVLVPLFLVYGRVAYYLKDFVDPRGDYILSRGRILLILFAYLLVLFLSLFPYGKVKRFLMDRILFIMIIVLTFSWTVMLFTIGLRKREFLLIIRKYAYLFENILHDGYWGILWIALAILFIISIMLPKIRGESIYLVYIISFVLLFNVANLFRRGWRVGWGDSGNRMLMHLIFIVFFYIMLKVYPVLFPRKMKA